MKLTVKVSLCPTWTRSPHLPPKDCPPRKEGGAEGDVGEKTTQVISQEAKTLSNTWVKDSAPLLSSSPSLPPPSSLQKHLCMHWCGLFAQHQGEGQWWRHSLPHPLVQFLAGPWLLLHRPMLPAQEPRKRRDITAQRDVR